MFKRWWFAVSLFALYGIGIATETDRFVSSANGDDLNGLNDCRDQSRPCKTIAHAIQKADAGDKIILSGGAPYQECGLELLKPLTIKSESIPAAVVVPNIPLDDCQKQDEKGEKKPAPFIFKISGEEAKGSIIEGIVIRARIKANPDAALIILENTFGIIVKDNQLVVLKTADDRAEFGIGIKVLNSSFNKITANKIQGTRDPSNAQGALLLQQAGSGRSLAGNRLDYNEIFDHGKEGIVIETQDLQPPSESPLYLLENVVKNNGGVGVDVRTTSSLKIERNQIRNNINAGIQFSSSCQVKACESIGLTANLIDSNGGEGILFSVKLGETAAQYKGVQILNNEIRNKHLSGIVLAKGQYNKIVIANNQLDRNQQEGIRIEELEGGSWLELKDNTISGTTKGGEGEGHGVTIKLTNKTGATRLVVSGNKVEKNAGSGLVLEGFNTTDGSDVRIERLISEGNKEGIVLKDSQKATVQSGQFNSNNCAGLILENSSDNTISNNTIESNGYSCSPQDGFPARFQLEGAGVILKGSSKLNTLEKNKLSYNLNGFSLRLSQSPEAKEGNHFLCNGIYKSDHSGILVLPEANVTALTDSFSNNNIVGNLSFGLRNFTNIAINAQQNWWGDKSGPKHETNPNGKGDRILGPADFSRWLTQPVDINRCP